MKTESINVELTRVEKDTLGEVEIPSDCYWGAQTQRSLENFQIGSQQIPQDIIYALVIIKKAAALTNYKLGILEKAKMELISQVCDDIADGKLDQEFPLSVWQTGSGTHTNMNINEVISNRAHVLLGNNLAHGSRFLSAHNDVNKSQSSNDTFPTAMHISAYKILTEKMLPALTALKESFELKANEFKSITKIGRTHFMDATPLTLGQEFSGYATQLDSSLKAIQSTLPHLAELAIGGTAVGTGLNTPAGYSEMVVAKLTELTKLPFKPAKNKFASLAAHDALVESHGALKQLAVALMKIANDIRILSSGPRTAIGEIILPANEPGSSIMPGKVNPTQAEALTMVCAQVIGNDTAMSIAGMSGQLELNTFKPMMIYNFLTSAGLLADSCRSFNYNCVRGIQPNMKRIQEHLNNSLMLVTALNPHIGYDNAAQVANRAYENDTTLKQAAIDLGFMNAKKFDEVVDPSKMI